MKRILRYTVNQLAENDYRRNTGSDLPSAETGGMIELSDQDKVELRKRVLYINNVRWVAIEGDIQVEEWK